MRSRPGIYAAKLTSTTTPVLVLTCWEISGKATLVAEVADKITAIYGEQANVILPIIDVYSFAMMALNGTDSDDLTKLNDSTRADYSAK